MRNSEERKTRDHHSNVINTSLFATRFARRRARAIREEQEKKAKEREDEERRQRER